METFHKLLREASQRFINADHMVYVTYPIINDPRLIIAITGHLYYTLTNAIEALIAYEYYHKKLDFMPRTIKEKLEVFRESLLKYYGFSSNFMNMFNDLNKIMKFREKSPIEFVRKSNFVICDNNYSTKMINFQKIKQYTQETKSFIQKIQTIVEQNGF